MKVEIINKIKLKDGICAGLRIGEYFMLYVEIFNIPLIQFIFTDIRKYISLLGITFDFTNWNKVCNKLDIKNKAEKYAKHTMSLKDVK
jgi:hypothetical protein